MADLSRETRDAVRDGAKRSAAAVLPIVFDTLGTPHGLLDVGTGEGHWMREAIELGVDLACGVDLAYDADAWQGAVGPIYWNAEEGTPLPWMPGTHRPSGRERWPLALCLEMAEHVTPAAGDHLVAELCRVADAVVWSAAIPGQGGDGHVNEQWPDYWHARFERHGWALIDVFRDFLWWRGDVEPWYRQNVLLARPVSGESAAPRPLVDPVTWAHHRGVPAPGVV